MSFTKISYEKKENIIYIGLGLNEEKSMTVLTETSLKELSDAFDQVAADKEAKGLLIFSHAKNCFLAGMDVSKIQDLASEEEATQGCLGGQAIFNKIEDLKIPSAALVDGICLGGGLEMSMACSKIIVSDNAKVSLGLPEVMLGVLPGFGGTYRMPKKIGLPAALDLLLSGKQVKGKKALKIGLADFMIPSEKMLELAPTYLFKGVKSKSLKESMMDAATDNFFARKIIFQKAREQVLKMSKGFYPAPLKIIDHLEDNYTKRRDSFLQKEAQAFGELSQTSQSKSLQHVFFLHDNSKKLENKDSLKPVRTGAVIGAGTMGGGIAWLFAKNDQPVFMKDINKEGLELGIKQSSSVFYKAFKRKRLSLDDFNRKQRSITPTLSYDSFQGVDLAIEAVVENMNVKKAVFKELEGHVSKECLLTSNTSSLSIEEMATALEDSSRFAGLHFFNPVNKMPLVEIIRHKNVSDETINKLYKWALDVKKTPIVVNDCPGFLVNRILAPFLNEAAYLLQEGLSIEALDKAVVNFGMPMGPARLMDEVGLDVCAHVGDIMQEGLGDRATACPLSHIAVEKNFLGKKNNKGFYNYDEKGNHTSVNSDILELLPKKSITMEEKQIQMRVFLPMINEAARILDEKIVKDAATVDLGLIFGIGFPPFRGGLLKYADKEGLENIQNAILAMADTVDAKRFELAPYLKDLVISNKTFY